MGVEQAISNLAPPSRPLTEFSEFILEDMKFSESIKSKEPSLNEANEFHANLKSRILPLVDKWNTNKSKGDGDKVIIRTNLLRLNITGRGDRFVLSQWAGRSFIDLDLTLIDDSNGEQISQISIRHDPGKLPWWTGVDQVDEYAIILIHKYLSDNYKTAIPKLKISQNKQSVGAIEVTGKYESKIIAESPKSYFKKGSFELTLIQDGNKVNGTFGSQNSGKIWGHIEGDTVKFDWISSGGDNGLGEWIVDTKNSELRGTWVSSSRNRFGKWNLKKIE